VETCDLALAFESKVALLLWQKEFCKNPRRFEACERFRLLAAGQPVPAGMLPNGRMAAFTAAR
jgi:hypothetical protein